jgi:hypothetical protein
MSLLYMIMMIMMTLPVVLSIKSTADIGNLHCFMTLWNCETLTINSHVSYPPEMATRGLNQSASQSSMQVTKTTQSIQNIKKIQTILFQSSTGVRT